MAVVDLMADIYHVKEDDKVEIKVTNFKGNSVEGGMGIREGQYILMTYMRY